MPTTQENPETLNQHAAVDPEPIVTPVIAPVEVPKLEKWVKRTEVIKNILEGIALLAAAIWAIFTFIVKDAPSLQDSMAMSSSVSIDTLGKDSVVVKLILDQHNIGKSTFIGDSVDIAYWIIPLQVVHKMKYFNLISYMDDKSHEPDTSFRLRYDEAGLNSLYVPDAQGNEDYTFFRKKDKKSLILFKYKQHLHHDSWLNRDTSVSEGTAWIAGIDQFNVASEKPDEDKDKKKKNKE